MDQPRVPIGLPKLEPQPLPTLPSAVVVPAPTAPPQPTSVNTLPLATAQFLDDQEEDVFSSDEEFAKPVKPLDVRYASTAASGVERMRDFSEEGQQKRDQERILRTSNFDALFKETEPFSDFVEPPEGRKMPSPLPGDSNDMDDPNDIMDTEDPYAREAEADPDAQPPSTDAPPTHDDSADAASSAEALVVSEPAERDAADADAVTSEDLAAAFDEDLLLRSDDDDQDKQKRPWRN